MKAFDEGLSEHRPPLRVGFFGFTILGVLLSACMEEAPKSAMDTVIIEGRALKTQESIRLSFPGSRLRFKICKGSAEFQFKTTNQAADPIMEMYLNSEMADLVSFHDGEANITLNFHPRIPGTQVDFRRNNEAWQGDVILTEADAYDGFCKPDPLPKTKLLFIGDSITAGHGTWSKMNAEGEIESEPNALFAYPHWLGDTLDAQVHQVAYGGRGLVRDWQGKTDTNNAPQFYDRVLPDNPDYLWDPKDYQADIVSVMLGTNDFNTGIPERESWTEAYINFVKRIRQDYPNAQIFLISSPMTDGDKGDVLKDYVKQVAENFGTPSVKYLQVGHYEGEPWDSHPTLLEHGKIAEELEPFFRAHLDE